MKVLQAVAGPVGGMLGGLADNKKGMRDATVSAIQCAVSLNEGTCHVLFVFVLFTLLQLFTRTHGPSPIATRTYHILSHPLTHIYCSTHLHAGDTAPAEPTLLAVLVLPIGEALTSTPVGRQELLTWVNQHVDIFKIEHQVRI